MTQIAAFSGAMFFGMIVKQAFGHLFGPELSWLIEVATSLALGCIMCHVGTEFEINKNNLKQYGKDALVGTGQATGPWLIASVFFYAVFAKPTTTWWDLDAWLTCLIVGRFAAPTSAGILLKMLESAGLKERWVYKKSRTLAIFDDIDTVLIVAGLKVVKLLRSGDFSSYVFVNLFVVAGCVLAAWFCLNAFNRRLGWKSLLAVSGIVTACSQFLYVLTDGALHIEVLLPTFTIGCFFKHQAAKTKRAHVADERASAIISFLFMALVGLGLPVLSGHVGDSVHLSTLQLVSYVLLLSLAINLAKLLPFPFYAQETASRKERLALGLGMTLRGEVGCAILIGAVHDGAAGPMLTVAVLCLTVNLTLTWPIVFAVRELVAPPEETIFQRLTTAFSIVPSFIEAVLEKTRALSQRDALQPWAIKLVSILLVVGVPTTTGAGACLLSDSMNSGRQTMRVATSSTLKSDNKHGPTSVVSNVTRHSDPQLTPSQISTSPDDSREIRGAIAQPSDDQAAARESQSHRARFSLGETLADSLVWTIDDRWSGLLESSSSGGATVASVTDCPECLALVESKE